MASNQENTVSWQSAFLGLVPLALNAMTQPSTLDIKLPGSSILFSARSSPFICVADALEVLIELCIHVYQGRKLREAAKLVNWSRAKRRLGSEITSLEESAAKKHPKSFFILFIATLLQAIKILGLGGLFWTKVWVGCYFCSYVVLAGVQFLAPAGWRDDPPHTRLTGDAPPIEEDIMAAVYQLVVKRLAVGTHIWFASNALSRVAHPHIPSIRDPVSQTHILSTSISSLFFSIGGLGYGLMQLAVFDFVFMLLNHVLLVLLSFLRKPSALQWLKDFLKDEDSSYLVASLAFLGSLFSLAMSSHSRYDTFLTGMLYVQNTVFSDDLGRSTLIICSGLVVVFFHLIFTVSKRVHFLRWLRPQPDVPQYVVVFPFLNFFVAFLYYRFAYDPQGTFQPAWTENLG